MGRVSGVRGAVRIAIVPVLAGAALVSGASAQLRPVTPLDWDVFADPRPLKVALGVGWLVDQPASLAGTSGDLLELGNFRVAWRSGRIGVEVAGTLLRRFDDEVVLRPPVAGSDPPNGGARYDAGDVVASTMVRLSGEEPATVVALRFGTRLPTPSNEPGLDRDRTDFFATLGGRRRVGPFAIGGEGGIGILGTRVDGLDQLDVLTYSASVETRLGPVTALGVIVGQDDWHGREIRGNEDLSEARLTLRAGGRTWFSATVILGIADFSPGGGLLFMGGVRR